MAHNSAGPKRGQPLASQVRNPTEPYVDQDEEEDTDEPQRLDASSQETGAGEVNRPAGTDPMRSEDDEPPDPPRPARTPRSLV